MEELRLYLTDGPVFVADHGNKVVNGAGYLAEVREIDGKRVSVCTDRVFVPGDAVILKPEFMRDSTLPLVNGAGSLVKYVGSVSRSEYDVIVHEFQVRVAAYHRKLTGLRSRAQVAIDAVREILVENDELDARNHISVLRTCAELNIERARQDKPRLELMLLRTISR